MLLFRYSLRGLVRRPGTTLLAGLGIALVVFVFAAVRMLGTGLHTAVAGTGRSDVALALQRGTDVEVTSAIDLDTVARLLADRRIARRADGELDAVAEQLVLLNLSPIGRTELVNLQLRGITDGAYAFRPEVQLSAGRKARPGTDECVIGKNLRGRFQGLELGQLVPLDEGRSLRVVGVIGSADSSFESEIWADAQTVRTAFASEGFVQALRMRLADPSAFADYARSIEKDGRLGVVIERESSYYDRQAESSAGFILGVGSLLAFLCALAAILGAMTTMYSAVASRRREIGILRALGFGGGRILMAFMVEALLLALASGALGALASLGLSALKFSVVSAMSWNEIIFGFEPSWRASLGSLAFATLLGVLGGLLPALRAARAPLLSALRGD